MQRSWREDADKCTFIIVDRSPQGEGAACVQVRAARRRAGPGRPSRRGRARAAPAASRRSRGLLGGAGIQLLPV
jgi:hypothetical protein